MNKSNILKLIEIGLSDSSAAQVLHSGSSYSQAYFYFQQSVEKGTKALGLILGIINSKDLPKISHDPFKIHRRMTVQSQRTVDDLTTAVEQYPAIKSQTLFELFQLDKMPGGIAKATRFIDSLHSSDLRNIDAEMVTYIINETS